jgi:phosphoribosylformylglycinamidine (FGAM) synthase-like enzyme
VLGIPARALPELDYDWFGRACSFVREAIARGLVSAVRDISDGGPIAALTEMAFAAVDRGRPIGFRVDLLARADRLAEDRQRRATDAIWRFDESPGFVLEVPLRALSDVQVLSRSYGIFSTAPYGSTIAEPAVEVRSADDVLIESLPLAELREAWDAPLRDFYGASAGSGPSTSSGPVDVRGPSTSSG